MEDLEGGGNRTRKTQPSAKAIALLRAAAASKGGPAAADALPHSTKDEHPLASTALTVLTYMRSHFCFQPPGTCMSGVVQAARGSCAQRPLC